MTELIKQRLVGMLIVVIAGVVFLPDLLDGKKQLTKEEFKKVPVKPEIDEQPIINEFPRVEVAKAIESAPELEDVKGDDEPVLLNGDEVTNEDSEQLIDSNEVEQNTTVDSELAKVEVEKPSVKAQSKFETQAWILQLGSFKHKENVDALRQKLKEAGFDTFTKPVKTKAGILSKVYIGPELEKESLQTAQNKLKEIAGIEGKITRFDPTK